MFVTLAGASNPVLEEIIVTALYDDNDGQELKNIITGQADEQTSRSTRLTLSWLINDNIDATLFCNYMDNDAQMLAALEGDAGD